MDWPVTVVLTPDALKIYSEIFSFLIQVRLAVFSLTDIWCSLKVWILTYCFSVVFLYLITVLSPGQMRDIQLGEAFPT